MLVLSRRTNEKIVFPSIATRIQIVAIKAGVVRLGIDAPPSIPIYREELLGRDEAIESATSPMRTPDAQTRHYLFRQLIASGVAEVLQEISRLRQPQASQQPPVPELNLDRLEAEVRRLERIVAQDTL